MKPRLEAIQPVLAVRDVAASVRFYALLGFEVSFEDSPSAPKYAAVLRAGTGFSSIALLHDSLTEVESDGDFILKGTKECKSARFLQAWLSGTSMLRGSFMRSSVSGYSLETVDEADESATGPACFIAVDPDGNPIIVDQHV